MILMPTFSEDVITKGKGGRPELRALESRGEYVLYKYLDPQTMKVADAKRKLCLRDQAGAVREYFIIPLKARNRSLLIEPEKKEKERKVWNDRMGREEELWS